MNPELEKLIALEQTDREILRLHEEIAALPGRVAEIESKLAQITSQVERDKSGLKQQEAATRQLESEIQNQQAKISKFRTQSLEVKNNEQYRALLHEIEFAEKEIAACEDKILEAMVHTESFEKSNRSGEEEIKRQRAAVEAEKAEARKRTAVDEGLVSELSARAHELRAQIEASTLAHYDRLMRQRKSAVAEARGQSCVACHVMLRPQKYNDIRTNEQIITCDSCGRILFYDPAHEPVVEPPRGRSKAKRRAAEEEDQAAETAAETPIA